MLIQTYLTATPQRLAGQEHHGTMGSANLHHLWLGSKFLGFVRSVLGPRDIGVLLVGNMERIWSCWRYWGCNCAIFCLCFNGIIMGLSNYVQLILGISETVSAVVVIHDIMSDCNHFILYVSHEIFPSFLSWYLQFCQWHQHVWPLYPQVI